MSEEAKRARREYNRKWREKNRERYNEYQKRWRKKNKDRIKEYQRKYWEKKAKEESQQSLISRTDYNVKRQNVPRRNKKFCTQDN